MPLIETSSGPIAYDERGTGNPIVMLPSGAHDRHDFDEIRELMPDGIRTIALDWPAHGESPPAEGPISAMRLADVAEEVVAQLAPRGAIVLGNSVGGFAAARMAIRRPELVTGLVIVDGGGFAGRPPHVRAFCALMARPRFLRAVYPAFSGRYMRARTHADRRARAVGVATTRRDPGLRAVSELWRSFASPEHDLRRDAACISAPTLLIWGRKDPVISLRLGRRIAAMVPNAELVVLDSGHVPHTSQPEAFAASLIAFTERALGSAGATVAA
ncbi:MAG: alpha/beta fold hydrolase [Solirubrobacteraceae bacterium]